MTAVCAFNDETAIAVLAGMRELGLTAPENLAIIGADDIPTARLTAPPLTTVCFDLDEAGRQRAEAVVARLSGKAPGHRREPGPARTHHRGGPALLHNAALRHVRHRLPHPP